MIRAVANSVKSAVAHPSIARARASVDHPGGIGKLLHRPPIADRRTLLLRQLASPTLSSASQLGQQCGKPAAGAAPALLDCLNDKNRAFRALSTTARDVKGSGWRGDGKVGVLGQLPQALVFVTRPGPLKLPPFARHGSRGTSSLPSVDLDKAKGVAGAGLDGDDKAKGVAGAALHKILRQLAEISNKLGVLTSMESATVRGIESIKTAMKRLKWIIMCVPVIVLLGLIGLLALGIKYGLPYALNKFSQELAIMLKGVKPEDVLEVIETLTNLVMNNVWAFLMGKLKGKK